MVILYVDELVRGASMSLIIRSSYSSNSREGGNEPLAVEKVCSAPDQSSCMSSYCLSFSALAEEPRLEERRKEYQKNPVKTAASVANATNTTFATSPCTRYPVSENAIVRPRPRVHPTRSNNDIEGCGALSCGLSGIFIEICAQPG